MEVAVPPDGSIGLVTRGIRVGAMAVVLFGLVAGAVLGSRAQRVLKEYALSRPAKVSLWLQIVFIIVGWCGYLTLGWTLIFLLTRP